MLSLEQIADPPTRSDIATYLKSTLAELGFSTTSWVDGSIQLTLLNGFASVAAGTALVAAQIAEAGSSVTARGAALTRYSLERYNNTRVAGTKAKGDFRLSNASTSNYTITVGQLVVTDSLGVEFTNTEGGSLVAGGTLNINFEALVAGTSGNVANNSALTLTTPLAGVTVTNPGPGDIDLDGFDDPWYDVVTGADPERDATLRQRNATKWGTLSTLKTKTAVENLALEQGGVTKVLVVANNPRGDNTVDVYVAADSALVSTAQITAAQVSFSENTFGTDSTWPVPDATPPSVYKLIQPTTQTLNVQGVIYYDANFTQAEVEDNVRARLDALIAETPIGGKEYTTSVKNVVTLSDINETIERARGVVSATLTTPTGNVVVGTTSLLVAPADWVTGLIDFEVAV